MEYDQNDAMKKALQSRRGKGIDVSIIVGPHDDEMAEQKNSDLAPPPEGGELDVDHPVGASPVMGGMSSMQDSDLVSEMSPFDKQDSMSRGQPRSLMERARKEMLMKGQK